MELGEERLADFGGIAEVVAQFRAAPCREARRNFFSVLLEHTVQRHIEARHSSSFTDAGGYSQGFKMVWLSSHAMECNFLGHT